jgi:hypothetical protein
MPSWSFPFGATNLRWLLQPNIILSPSPSSTALWPLHTAPTFRIDTAVSTIRQFTPKPVYCSSTASFSTVSSLLTLFSKFFSSFLRSTCSLSVSRVYLALEEVYLPLRAAVPNNPTLRSFSYSSILADYGVVTLFDVLFQRTYASSLPSDPPFRLQFFEVDPLRFTLWALACSLAVTGAIFVNFFSSAYWYA